MNFIEKVMVALAEGEARRVDGDLKINDKPYSYRAYTIEHTGSRVIRIDILEKKDNVVDE